MVNTSINVSNVSCVKKAKTQGRYNIDIWHNVSVTLLRLPNNQKLVIVSVIPIPEHTTIQKKTIYYMYYMSE